MFLSLVTILVVPIIVFTSIFEMGNIFDYGNNVDNQKDGKVLGVNEDFDESFGQVLITKKEKMEISNCFSSKIFFFWYHKSIKGKIKHICLSCFC
jgi:hypothetical protein